MLPPTAAGSSSAVVIRSSTLIDSMSKAWRIWAQPSRRICTTASWSLAGSNCVFTACGWVMTSLSASAVAKSLTRIISMLGTDGHSVRGTQSLKTTAIIAIRSLQKDFFAGGTGGIAKGARIGRSGDDTAMNCQPTLRQAALAASNLGGKDHALRDLPLDRAARLHPPPGQARSRPRGGPGRCSRFHPLPRLRRPGHRPLLRGFVRAARAGCAGRVTAWRAIVRQNARGAGARPARRAPAGSPARRSRKTTSSRSLRRCSRRSRTDRCARTPPAR